ncbi:MAG: ATPase, T2SS/T4P/T4SS family [Phycisphaerae bacterium]|nr:ATPase, T2SS/T4P/T4SS family [Phycisphaerae bacterium]
MPDVLAISVEFGGYISIIKFAIFVILFFASLPLIAWINNDAEQIDTNRELWAGIVFGAVAISVLLWLLIPMYIVGLVIYILLVSVVAIVYIKHRNSIVMDYDRILTTEHIAGLFGKKKEQNSVQGLVFITANKNEIPLPPPKTPEYFGYRASSDLFTDAIWRRASKVLFIPGQESYNVVYEIDGVAVKQQPQPLENIRYLFPFLKQLANLDVSEKRKPQKGTFKIRNQGSDFEWQVVTAGSTAGEQVQLKCEQSASFKELADLGLSSDQVSQLEGLSKIKKGLFIVSGPPKSGATTTFYTLVRNHDAFLNSIHTLEKHPAGKIPNVTQDTYNLSDTGTTTYALKLRSIIRTGPDIVGVGNCEDAETATTAYEAAKDGRLVYVVLNANSVADALKKWISLVGGTKAIDVLVGISSQRLLRRLCEQCKEAYTPNREVLKKFNLSPEKAKMLYREGKVIYDKRGKPMPCDMCQESGYFGRTGVFEMVVIDEKLREDMKKVKSLPEISSLFRGAKMLYLQEQALRKILKGITAINEMIRLFSTQKTEERKSK